MIYLRVRIFEQAGISLLVKRPGIRVTPLGYGLVPEPGQADIVVPLFLQEFFGPSPNEEVFLPMLQELTFDQVMDKGTWEGYSVVEIAHHLTNGWIVNVQGIPFTTTVVGFSLN